LRADLIEGAIVAEIEIICEQWFRHLQTELAHVRGLFLPQCWRERLAIGMEGQWGKSPAMALRIEALARE